MGISRASLNITTLILYSRMRHQYQKDAKQNSPTGNKGRDQPASIRSIQYSPTNRAANQEANYGIIISKTEIFIGGFSFTHPREGNGPVRLYMLELSFARFASTRDVGFSVSMIPKKKPYMTANTTAADKLIMSGQRKSIMPVTADAASVMYFLE